jgi:hypothetical protein
MKNGMYLILDKTTLSSLCSLIRDYCSTKTLTVHRHHRDLFGLLIVLLVAIFVLFRVFELPANNWYQS